MLLKFTHFHIFNQEQSYCLQSTSFIYTVILGEILDASNQPLRHIVKLNGISYEDPTDPTTVIFTLYGAIMHMTDLLTLYEGYDLSIVGLWTLVCPL